MSMRDSISAPTGSSLERSQICKHTEHRAASALSTQANGRKDLFLRNICGCCCCLPCFRSSRRDASDEEVKAAAKVAQLEDLIKKLGDSTIGEGGSKLSKGQRQCIAIASAILKRPRLLVLDEPTSNLDYDTEAEILKNLRHELTHVSTGLQASTTA